MVRSAIGVIAAILATSLAHLAAQQATFRAGTELVSVTATVTDRRGQHLTDLTREDFEVLEDGKPQTSSSSPAEILRQDRSCTSGCCSTPAAAWTPTSRCPDRRRSSFSTR